MSRLMSSGVDLPPAVRPGYGGWTPARDEVLVRLRNCGTRTDSQIADALGVTVGRLRTRVSQLRDEGRTIAHARPDRAHLRRAA